jgi:hypothetical protein
VFKDLEQYYSLLDSIEMFDVSSIALSNKLKEIKGDFKELDEVFKTEIYFNDIEIKRGEFIPLYTVGNECYPSLEHFDNLTYLKERAENCKNPRFSAKYNHLIFLKTKNNQFAKVALDKYFEQLKKVKVLTQNNTQKLFLEDFENLVLLAKNIKYKEQEIIAFSKELIDSKIIQDFCFSYIISFLTKNLKMEVTNKQFFFDSVSSVLEANLFPKTKKDLLELAIYLAQKTSYPAKHKIFTNQLGDFFVEEGKRVGGMIAHNYFLKAMNCYKATSNIEKLNEVSVLMQKAKENNGLTTVNFSFTDPVLDLCFKMINQKINSLLELENSNVIIEYLISANDLFPKASLLNEFHKTESLEHITTSTFDNNKNISLNTYQGSNYYSNQIQLLTTPQLELIFDLGLKNGKLNYNTLSNFFETETWLNKVDASLDTNKSEINSTNWLDFILPPLKMYFELIENEEDTILNKEKLVLVIDSLTLKFEGVLRDFLFRIGGQTIESFENKTAERISFESLLNNNIFKTVVPEDDIAFFKYLFTREGINLRNNVAHCFYKQKDYSPILVWLLICAFLKIGNFEFKPIN